MVLNPGAMHPIINGIIAVILPLTSVKPSNFTTAAGFVGELAGVSLQGLGCSSSIRR